MSRSSHAHALGLGQQRKIVCVPHSLAVHADLLNYDTFLSSSHQTHTIYADDLLLLSILIVFIKE
jgi:hypothetical protein